MCYNGSIIIKKMHNQAFTEFLLTSQPIVARIVRTCTWIKWQPSEHVIFFFLMKYIFPPAFDLSGSAEVSTTYDMVCLSNFGSYQEIFLSRSFQKYWEIFLGVFSRCRLLSKPGCSLAHSFHQSTSHSEHSRRVHFKSFAYWPNKELKMM